MTIKGFFRKYAEAQTRLEGLKCQLKILDYTGINIGTVHDVKVKGGKSIKEEDKIIGDIQRRERLEYEIAMLEFEVSRVEHAFKIIGENGLYSARILKRKYINCHSINKIANDFNLPPSKVKKILKNTEDLLSCLLD